MTDDWTTSVFTESEKRKLTKAFAAMVELETQEPEIDPSEYICLELGLLTMHAKEVITWCRQRHYAGNLTTPISDLLYSVGMAVSLGYLTDEDWEYDEEMSDHATYFGARDWFENMDDEDEDDDD